MPTRDDRLNTLYCLVKGFKEQTGKPIFIHDIVSNMKKKFAGITEEKIKEYVKTLHTMDCIKLHQDGGYVAVEGAEKRLKIIIRKPRKKR